jgi:hypothetical protein
MAISWPTNNFWKPSPKCENCKSSTSKLAIPAS